MIEWNADVDWSMLTNLLRTHYKPLSSIANEMDLCEVHLNRLARGEVQEPRYNTGRRLIRLAYDVLPESEFRRIATGVKQG